MILLPQGTLRRRYFESCDRWLGKAIFGDSRTVSTHIGNRLISGQAKSRHYLAAAFIDLITFEQAHCFKNAGKA